jgi:hypothetical protein
MSQEKQTSLNFTAKKNGLTVQALIQLTEDLAGAKMNGTRQVVPTAWTAVQLGSVATADLLCVQNDDPTNYVQLAIASDGTGIFAKLTAKRAAFFPPDPTATIYAKADTASCPIIATTVEA